MPSTLFDSPFSCFVTGTDTEIGKTLIASTIIHLQTNKGYRVAGMKPVAAGTLFREHPPEQRSQWFNEDVESLAGASNLVVAQELMCPYLFKLPVAPHIAARLENVQINPSTILKAIEQIKQLSQAVVVEGVGGFRVPLTQSFDTADLAVKLKLPVILVVAMRLGCINHALLTAEAIRSRGLELVGWVANSAEEPMNKLEENIEAIDARIKAPRLAHVPFLIDVSVQTALRYFDI